MLSSKQWKNIFVRSRLKLLVGVLLGILFFFLLNRYVLPTKYSSSSALYFQGEISDSFLEQIQVNLDSDQIRSSVAEQVSTNLDIEAFNKSVIITLNSADKSIAIWAETEDAKISMNICNGYLSVAENAARIFLTSKNLSESVKIVKIFAKESDVPSSPNLVENLAFGAFVGFFVALALIIILELLDDTVGTKKELEEIVDVNILGEIPDFF